MCDSIVMRCDDFFSLAIWIVVPPSRMLFNKYVICMASQILLLSPLVSRVIILQW